MAAEYSIAGAGVGFNRAINQALMKLFPEREGAVVEEDVGAQRTLIFHPPKSGRKQQNCWREEETLRTQHSRLSGCCELNSLFRKQAKFVDAERLAAALGQAIAPSALVESVLVALETAGELAHVPAETLANLTMSGKFTASIARSEVPEVIAALTRSKSTTLLLASMCRDILQSLIQYLGNEPSRKVAVEQILFKLDEGAKRQKMERGVGSTGKDG